MQLLWHNAIKLNSINISYGTKSCINDFSTEICCGSRIGIIGRNGSGKSSLIKALAGIINVDGIFTNDDIVVGYVPQLIVIGDDLSGGQRFNHALSQELSKQPNVLLLDEPSNHLDVNKRKSLCHMLKRYAGTLIIVSHDVELLNSCVDSIWHVYNGNIEIFNGKYTDYTLQHQQSKDKLQLKVNQLNKEKVNLHDKLMMEQSRAKHSKENGEKHILQRKWPTVRSATKVARSNQTADKNKKDILYAKAQVSNEVNRLFIPEEIIPRFNLSSGAVSSNRILVNIQDGFCRYQNNSENVLHKINFSISSTEKVFIAGDNASGKSTLLKAILGCDHICVVGEWLLPKIDDIGYLDQHYSHLLANKTAVELMMKLMPMWSYAEIRLHLNTFLLRKNEEAEIAVNYLSGGEKVRLSLALIAAKPPKLLVLDEVTNNIDLETKQHLIQVLRKYPSAMILVCHDIDFISRLNIDSTYTIQNGNLTKSVGFE